MARNYGDVRIVEFDAIAAQFVIGSHGHAFWSEKASRFREQHEADEYWRAQKELPVSPPVSDKGRVG